MEQQEAENNLQDEAIAGDTEDAEALKQALAEEQKKTEEYLSSWQRAQADFINYKRRTEQERADFNRFAGAHLILSLLPVLDDLERALNSMPPKLAKNNWLEGIKLIERKLRGILETEGLSPIKAIGESFDPYLHEAIRQEKGEEGIIIEEVQKGYEFRNRVIRPSKVVVGNGEDGASD